MIVGLFFPAFVAAPNYTDYSDVSGVIGKNTFVSQAVSVRPITTLAALTSKQPTQTEIKDYIRKVFGWRGETAIYLLESCENQSLDVRAVYWPDATVYPYVPSTGLFMHHEGFFEGWDDYRVSIDRAWEKFQEGGWRHWRNCAKSLKII